MIIQQLNSPAFTFRSIFLKVNRLLILFLMGTTVSLQAQDTDYKKNSMYVNLGLMPTANQVSVSYERLLFTQELFRTKAKINYGKYLSNNADFEDGARVYNNYRSVSIVQLINLFELNLGLAHTEFSLARNITERSESMNSFLFYASAGIRYEKQHLILRAGIGNLELLYVGMGIGF